MSSSESGDYYEEWDDPEAWGLHNASDSEPDPPFMREDSPVAVETHDKYQLELGETLFEVVKEFSFLSDFTIICPAAKDAMSDAKVHLHTYKLLLLARSKYFEALFRQEPKTTSANLDFDSSLVDLILKNLIKSPDLTSCDVDQLLGLLEVTDFLQMESLTNVIFTAISEQLGIENITNVVNHCQDIHIPVLHKQCRKWVKQNICNLQNILSTLPTTFLKSLSSEQVPGAKDEYGRLLCLNDAETLLVIALNELQPDEDWEVSEETRKRMFCSLKRDFGKLRLKEEMRELLCSKYKLIEIKLDPKDDDILIRANMKLKETHALWGSAPNAFFHPHVERLSVRGNFRKVGVKTRMWDGRKIVQGLRLELDTGEVKCMGMEERDTVNVTELRVPKGQHIKDVFLQCGWYIDAIGFVTNEDVFLGPVGGDGGGENTVGVNTKKYSAYYLYEISYLVVRSDNSDRNGNGEHSQPCIARVQFNFILIP